MKSLTTLAALSLAIFLVNCATPNLRANSPQSAQWQRDIQEKSRLVGEVYALRAADRFERNKIIALLNDQTIPKPEKDARVKELGDFITANDRARTRRLKEIFQTTDLMAMAQLDEGMASSAFMIIIHAVDDLAFQKSQLPLALELVKKGLIGNQEYAILSDKIAVSEGKPQVYGTQGKCENNVWQVLGEHDRAAIIAARTEIGLEPLDDYLRQGAALYGCGRN
jgi:hypothetical protein